jgi:hypothetical protein
VRIPSTPDPRRSVSNGLECRASALEPRFAHCITLHPARGPIGRWRRDALEWPASFFPIAKKDVEAARINT